MLLATLHAHLERHHIEYLQFAFRWMNNLLMREMPLHCVIRLWDTYLVQIFVDSLQQDVYIARLFYVHCLLPCGRPAID